jgi:hypothetical protein
LSPPEKPLEDTFLKDGSPPDPLPGTFRYLVWVFLRSLRESFSVPDLPEPLFRFRLSAQVVTPPIAPMPTDPNKVSKSFWEEVEKPFFQKGFLKVLISFLVHQPADLLITRMNPFLFV